MDTSGVPYDRLTDREVDRALAGDHAARRHHLDLSRRTRRSCRPGAAPPRCRRLARRRGARLYDESPVTGIRGGEVTAPRPHDRRRPRGDHRRRLDQRPAGPPRRPPPADRAARAGHLLRAGAPGRVRPRSPAGLDLDGRPLVLRLPDVRGSAGEGGAGLRRRGHHRRDARLRHRPGRARAARLLRRRPAARHRAAAPHGHLPLHPDAGPRLRHRRRPGPPGGVRRARRRPRLQVRADLRPGAGRPGDDRRHEQRDRRRSPWIVRLSSTPSSGRPGWSRTTSRNRAAFSASGPVDRVESPRRFCP